MRKFVNVLALVWLLVYTKDISQTKGKIMATKITLTDNEVIALSKWLTIAQESEAELVSWDPSDKGATTRLKALENIDRKIEKEGWE